MHDPLLGLLKGEPSQRWASTPNYRSGNDDDDAAPPVPTFVSLGQALYNSLFDRALRDSWLTAQGVAQNRRSPLRLRLGLKGEKLQQLPWEILHAGDRPLGTGTDVTFSRYHLGRRQGYDRPLATVPDFEQPLRVLMVIAAPTDQDRLELANEVEQLQKELHPTSMRSGSGYSLLPKQQLDVQLTVLKQPGRAELTQALEQGNYQALHYAGHSNLGNAGGDLYLVSRQTGLTERISGEDLAGLLSNNGIKLAVLNSCRGAYAQSTGPEVGWHEQNLAQALVNRGIPGVIAMAERIPDNVAITFTQLLYRNLKQGNPIDLCLNRTRQGLISAHGSHYSYWALPILYMQPGFDGYLASKPGEDSSALDKLLSESESALKALDQQPAAMPGVSDSTASDSTAASGIDPAQVDLDNLVETVELDEFLRYDDDSDDSSVPELVEKLSQPAVPDQVMLADVDESLIPETLETPGLDLYEQLPQKPAPQPDDESDDGGTIYGDDTRPKDLRPAEPAANKRSGISKRRQRQVVAMGIGTAALLGIVGVSISDPLAWFNQSSQPNSPIEVPSSEPIEVKGVITGDSDSDFGYLDEMAAKSQQDKAIAQIDALADAHTNPSLLFVRGQLQWDLMHEISPSDIGSIEEQASNAAVSWQEALDINPNWVDAQVAIGFAYYERGWWDEAIEIWTAALEKGRNYEDVSSISLREGAPKKNIHNAPIQVHAQAGLAMIYSRQADEQGSTQIDQQRLRSLAVDYWKTVVETADAKGFTPTTDLTYHWLWSQKALQDWEKAYSNIADYVSQSD